MVAEIPSLPKLCHKPIVIDDREDKAKGAFRKFIGKAKNAKLNEGLLQDYAIILIPDRNDLTEIRIKILSQQITKRGGKFFDFSAFGDFPKFLTESKERVKVIISSKTNLYEVYLLF